MGKVKLVCPICGFLLSKLSNKIVGEPSKVNEVNNTFECRQYWMPTPNRPQRGSIPPPAGKWEGHLIRPEEPGQEKSAMFLGDHVAGITLEEQKVNRGNSKAEQTTFFIKDKKPKTESKGRDPKTKKEKERSRSLV